MACHGRPHYNAGQSQQLCALNMSAWVTAEQWESRGQRDGLETETEQVHSSDENSARLTALARLTPSDPMSEFKRKTGCTGQLFVALSVEI